MNYAAIAKPIRKVLFHGSTDIPFRAPGVAPMPEILQLPQNSERCIEDEAHLA